MTLVKKKKKKGQPASIQFVIKNTTSNNGMAAQLLGL
jgi:hypothetical protein